MLQVQFRFATETPGKWNTSTSSTVMNVTSWHQMKKEISDEELDTINMILYVKDRYNISGGGLSRNGTALERDAMSLPT